MAGWQYRTFIFDPDGSETEEEWAAKIAADGWRMWMLGPGQWATIGGKYARRWSLVRYVERPFAVTGNEGRVWMNPPEPPPGIQNRPQP